MGWTRQLPSGRHQACYRDSTGATRTAGSHVHQAAALRAANVAEDQARRSPERDERMTWGQWEPTWLAARAVAPSTAKHDAGRLAKHVRPRWGEVRLGAITPDAVDAWVVGLQRDGLAAATAIRCYHLLSASLRAAVRARLIPTSPCQGVSLPRLPPTQDRYVSQEEEAAIHEQLEIPDRTLVRLLLGTGLRLGELLGLHWQAVDLSRPGAEVLHVETAWDLTGLGMRPPKSHARRTVPLGASTAALLRELEQARTSVARTCGVPHRGTVRCRSGLVQPGHRAGRALDGDNLRARWDRALLHATVETKPAGPGTDAVREPVGSVRLHDLRHTYASRLVREGVPLLAVSRILGHSSVLVTERYSHLADSQWDAVRAVLDGTGVQQIVQQGGSHEAV